MQFRRDASRAFVLFVFLALGSILCISWLRQRPFRWAKLTALRESRPSCEDLTSPSCCLTGAVWSHAEVQEESPYWPWISYKSSDITPPKWEIGGNGGPLAPGYLFFAQYGPEARQDALLITTSENGLVYGLPIDLATNVHVAEYHGAQMLVSWSGCGIERQANGHHWGQVNFMDEGYEVVRVVCGDLDIQSGLTVPTPCSIDNHEQIVTPRGTVLVGTYNVTAADLSPVNGTTDGWILDNILFELDIATSEILFQWSAKDHVAFETSHQLLVDGGTYTKPCKFQCTEHSPAGLRETITKFSHAA